MYLKELSINGFKSFTDKTTLSFGPGITAIVGPNGSGKSNISDAIRWAMGEQSARALRGGKMEDVIFAGTERIKPGGYAEVSILLDNKTGIFPIDYEEVCVTRRAFRSGESEYFINKAPCRLKDVHELFMDTGLGRDGYSVIGQGKIDTILSSRPEERREIFEEAAGVSKYKYRKEEAERKLVKTGENLERTLDIIHELKERLGPLSESAERAKKYLSLSEKLKILDVNLALKAVEKREGELERLEGLLKSAEERLKTANSQFAQTQESLTKTYESAKEEDARIDNEREGLHSLELWLSKAEGEIAFSKENIKVAESEREALAAALAARKDGEGKVLTRLENEKTAKQSVLKKLAEAGGAVARLEDEAAVFSAKTKAASDEIELLRRLLATLESEAAALKNKIEGAGDFESDFKGRAAALSAALLSAQKRFAEFSEKAKTHEKEKAGCEAALTAARAAGSGALAKIADKKAKAEKLKGEFNSLISRLGGCESRLKLLTEMEAGFEGYFEGVKALASGAPGAPPIRGVISRLITVPEKLCAAVDVALGALAQNLVVNTDADAKAAIEYLKAKKLGRATFLPLSSVKPLKLSENVEGEKGVLGIAANLISFPAEISAAVNYLLGRTVIADNFDNAAALSRRFNGRLRIVTLEGEIINPGGAVTGGSAGAALRPVSRALEVKSLKKECARLENAADKADGAVLTALEEIKKLSDESDAFSAAESKADSDIIKHEAQAELGRRLAAEAKGEVSRIEGEMKALAARGENLEKERERAAALLAENGQRLETAQKAFEKEQAALKEMIEKREGHFSLLLAARTQEGLIKKEAELCDERIARAREEISSFGEETEKIKNNFENASAKIREMLSFVDAKEKEVALAREKMQKANESLSNLITLRAGADDAADALRQKDRELQQKILLEGGEQNRLTSLIDRAKNAEDALIERLWNEYELTLTAARAMRSEIGSATAAARAISALKADIKALGSINTDSIEEYGVVKERHDFLAAQAEDLENAKKDLGKIIGELETEIKERFKERFEDISAQFKTVFAQLFGGGRAELRLAEPNNILESAIEIVAEPPGKKLQSITLLSGGEKAFTAIALLFAILKTKPTPFCLLDEIEANLDENNVYRFAQYLKKHKGQTQFILVTHRRGTMEAADILYGVTMQEKGISRLLTMRLDEAMAK